LKAAVIVHVLLDLVRLLLGDALGEFLAPEKALEDEIGAAAGGVGAWGLEELSAQGTAAEAVDRLHLLEEGLLFLAQGVEIELHSA